MKWDVQGQGGGRILDVDGQGGGDVCITASGNISLKLFMPP